MSKVINPTKVITGPKTRWSYANVWDPKSINGGAPKYSVSLIIPKSDTKTSNPSLSARMAAPHPLSPAPNTTILFSIYLTFSVMRVNAAIIIVTIQKRTVTFASCMGCSGPLNT